MAYIKKRDQKKLERLECLRKNISKLRKKVKRDLQAKNEIKRSVALAVSLMDQTYERVGNIRSAEDRDHYGVTVWKKKHIKFKDGKASICYVGKSGVAHKKEVSDPAVVKALKEACKNCKDKNDYLFHFDHKKVVDKDINVYLKDFGITAKDIRGFHANREVCELLKKTRREGNSLEGLKKKEKQSILKKEFLSVLDEVAKIVGHKATTLRSQYLAPNLEKTYMKDGTVLSNYMKKASLLPVFDPLFNLREICKHLILLEDHLAHPRKRCPDCIRKHLLTVEAFSEEGLSLTSPGEEEKYFEIFYNLTECTRFVWDFFCMTTEPSPKFFKVLHHYLRKLRKEIVGMMVDLHQMKKIATKSRQEKEEEEIEKFIKKPPKKKPPRKDLRKSKMKVEDEDLEETKSDEKDMSLNYKKVAS